MTTIVGMPPTPRLRVAPSPMASELSTTAHRFSAMNCQGGDQLPAVAAAGRPENAARQGAGRVPGPDHEAAHRPEGLRRGGAEKMQAGDGGLEPGRELRIPVLPPQRVAD